MTDTENTEATDTEAELEGDNLEETVEVENDPEAQIAERSADTDAAESAVFVKVFRLMTEDWENGDKKAIDSRNFHQVETQLTQQGLRLTGQIKRKGNGKKADEYCTDVTYTAEVEPAGDVPADEIRSAIHAENVRKSELPEDFAGDGESEASDEGEKSE